MDKLANANTTLLPSAKDLLLVLPRLAQRAGTFAFTHIPEAVGDIKGVLFNGGSVIADATGRRVLANTTITNTSAILAQQTAAVAEKSFIGSWTQGSEDAAASMFGMLIHGIGKLKNLGGVFSYLTSRWALATFTAAILLNRAQFYASSRENLRLRWYVRLAVYLTPILAFLIQMHNILQTMKCQTSPDYSQFRYNDPLKDIPMDFGGEGGFLYSLSSTLLWWKDDAACCVARKMSLSAVDGDRTLMLGSMSLLFWFFITLCASQLFDTLACALQGKQPVPETGMTIFEHSLAFAECEAMISSAVGLGFFGLPKLDSTASLPAADQTGVFFTRGEILQRLNVPPEVLLVCLISCFSHLSSASLAIAGIREKVRLVNTGVWACCYMSAFLWSFFRVFSQPIQNITDLGVLRFPTVCIVGFIPHVLILSGIVLCGMIYSAALLLTALSIPENVSQGMTFQQRLQWAYSNLQANVQFSQSSAIRIKMSEDFYTTILKIGFNVLTAASEAVYLNEGMRIQIAQTTWLEKKRLDELATNIAKRKAPAIPAELVSDEIARGVEFIDASSRANTSPYARERRSKQRAGESARHAVELDSGLGLTQRKSRMQLTFDFIVGLFWLTVGVYAHLILSIFRRLRIPFRPAWLVRAAGLDTHAKKVVQVQSASPHQPQDFYMLAADGRLKRATDEATDVEEEMRKRYMHQGKYQGEEHLSEGIYRWWSGGGWFGEGDASADYEPSTVDDDVTSVISMSTNASGSEWSDVDDESGRRTPTQRTYFTRDSTPEVDDGYDVNTLARLLNPLTTADQDEARMLSLRLRSPRSLTRNRYKRAVDLQRSQVVRGMSPQMQSLEDEERDLEKFILEQREKSRHKHGATWATGAEGMGETGPQLGLALIRYFRNRSMQPETQQAPQQALLEQITSLDSDNTFQHGSQIQSGISLQSAVQDDASLATGDCATVSGANARRLSQEGNASSFKSRVEEYERSSSPPKAVDNLVFKVAPNAASDPNVCSISQVPNELLTHVLSHLSPSDLAATALVSRRLHALVTTPHAWRSAFARYFPGPESMRALEAYEDEGLALVRSDRRAFTRLTPKASWRSEYVLRTRLLRSLARGKPVQIGGSTGGTQASRTRLASPEVTYSSELLGSINQIHAVWQTGPNKRAVKFVHGADDLGTASISDPSTAKVERWGFTDPQLFLQFTDLNPGDAQYGLGPGEVVGAPNVMSLSQSYGMIYGLGHPGGSVYFRSNEEMRGRFLLSSSTASSPKLGIPGIASTDHAITAVWIAKSNAIPTLTDGLIGMLSGASSGVLTAYSIGSLGAANNRTARFTRGEMTARWVLSPGVPLIAIAVDNEYTIKRQAENRVWAVVLNALGEVFYITKFPRRARLEQTRVDDEEFAAWMAGRSVYWTLAEPSRRVARPDPYNELPIDGSYSPRSSWNGMCLSSDQIEAETREIESFARKLPKEIQKSCLGWDMRRRLEVDFAGDDEQTAGEVVVVFECGHDDGSVAAVTRYTRLRVQEKADASRMSTPSMTTASTPLVLAHPTPFSIDGPHTAEADLDGTSTPRPMVEEWRTSRLSFGGLKKVRITTTAIDSCLHALQTQSEDPLLNLADASVTSSPSLGPWSGHGGSSDAQDVPGQRARFVAVGTYIGSVIIWNMREATSKSADLVNVVEPVRIIFTDSPQISSLALSSLYLVHGGSDGLVQAWDILASDLQPVRTLNSRFSSRARRQLIQAQASPHGTRLSSAVSSRLATDSAIGRIVHPPLTSTSLRNVACEDLNAAATRQEDRFSGTRTNLKDYIASERFELERDKQQRRKEADHMAGRFGTELLDGSEEEMIAYASMLSQETLAQETMRRSSDTASAADSTAFSSSESVSMWSSDNTATPPVSSPTFRSTNSKTEEELEADIAEAIRQSLQASPSTPAYEVAFRPAKAKPRKGSSAKASPNPGPLLRGSSKEAEKNDLDFAIQLSLAEEASRSERIEEFPSLQAGKGKSRQF
ncbi:hypothetical protein AMS68_005252 [Peltaster fructicola]|uniref:F-box domain-containing protein n=1 Tax=Peltaster fructicola TaxID=286661 RepID=A0A6H0XYJ4_9PEZI|nr:hypothetical protein AMS68_005252 [Peltaster fructicola]